jgi:hypothetical protein
MLYVMTGLLKRVLDLTVAIVIFCHGWFVGLKCMCYRNDDNDFGAF